MICQSTKSSPKIDSHQHFWLRERGDYDWLTEDLGPIYDDFMPSELAPILRSCGIDGTILVQAAATEEETRFMLELATQHEWILGVVGWLNMDSSQASEQLNLFCKSPKFCGIRPMLQDIDQVDWILEPARLDVLRELAARKKSFDALVRPVHLPAILEVANQLPDLTVVIDHCAKPDLTGGDFDRWHRDLTMLAANENTYCKLSGLVTEASPSDELAVTLPYIAAALDVFGPRRVLWGSDWPVVNLRCSYSEWHDFVVHVLQGLSEEERGGIFGQNAMRAYRLALTKLGGNAVC